MKIKKSSKQWAESRDAEKAFWQYWEKRWPFTSSNEKVLSLSGKPKAKPNNCTLPCLFPCPLRVQMKIKVIDFG